MVFPGQGSQTIGMMMPYVALPAVRATFVEAGEVLGIDLWGLVTEGPPEALNKTVNTQVVMLAAGIALFRAWRQAGGPAPNAVAGHSLGEYTALVAADVIEFGDALVLVRARAQAMQDAVPEGVGAIAAILGLDDAVVEAVCRDASQGQVLEAANYNAPGQVVIAGHRTAVERGMALAKERGAKRVVLLPMSAPSHCSLMKPSAIRLAEGLARARLSPAVVPVVNNADAVALRDPQAIRDSLIRQLSSPVRWVDIVRVFASQGITRIVECGPVGVLTPLNKRTIPEIEAIALKDADQLVQLAQQSSQTQT